MAVPHLWLTAALLLVPFCAHCSSSEPVCPQPCSCDSAPVLNCSSSRLSSAPRLIKYSVTELDLSHNLLTSVTFHRPHHNLRRIWLGNNSITHLSLCLERQVGGRYLRHGFETLSGRGCLTWAPTLQLLSIERNQLERLPEGLDGVEFLQILQLSFNRIAILQPGELSHLRQLKELHLQHNLLTHLQPQIFQNLVQLRVLDLSFNMLTSLNPLMYLTLRNIGTAVTLDGNIWHCDCRMSGLQRWMAFDKSRGLRGWSVVCLSPSNLSGRDLQQLEEGDLTCSTTEDSPDRHQDVTVYRGSEILLSCSAQDSVWWTPSGQASGSQHQGGLIISDISEKDVGLYVCVSQEDDTVSVFNLQISEMAGARKSNPSRTRRQIIPPHTSDTIDEERNQRATQSDLALAVCLSILFTFLIAFILGVLARPYVDALWKRMSKKKTNPAATVATVEQRQYENMGFSNAEEAVETGPHRERRVTFSSADFGEDSHLHYYDTVASGDQVIVKGNAVIECETAEAKKDMHTAGNSGSEHNLQQSSQVNMQSEDSDSDGITVRQNQEFERIPDRSELGERRSLSSSSDSSLSERVSKDQMAKGIHAMPKSPQLAEDTFQQRADSSTAQKVKVPKNSRKDKSQIPGFSSEPFADWSPHKSNRNRTDENSSQDNEELFEFSDSSQSISARSSSVFGSFNYPKEAIKPSSDKDKKGGISSSSSFSSSDNCKEPKQNKIKKEKGKERSTSNNGSLSSMVGAQGGTKKRLAPKPPTAKFPSSSTSGSKEENTDLNVGPHQKETSQTKGYLDVRTQTPTSDSLSSDESADDVKDKRTVLKKKNPRIHDSQEVSAHSSTLWPPLDLDHTTHVKRHLVIKAPSLRSDSSSNSDSENETTLQEKINEQVHTSKPPVEGSQAVGHKQENQWPAIDLGYVKRVKKRLDIKAPSASSDSSSSSDSEDDTTGNTGSRRPGILDIGLSLSDSKTQGQSPDGRWPALDLHHIPHVRRHLDFKAPRPASDSSSSSDSENETSQKKNISIAPVKVPQTVIKEPENQWPYSNPGQSSSIKRNQEIKAPAPSSDSSSSSDSEGETAIQKKDNERLHLSKPPVNVSQTVSHKQENQWPVVALGYAKPIKRRLNIKAPSASSDSSSRSKSEDDTTGHTGGRRPGMLDIGLPLQGSKTKSEALDGMWPVLDLHHIPHVRRHLDFKATRPASDLSSSSDSENETFQKKDNERLNISIAPVKVPQTVSQESKKQWPSSNLGPSTSIKRDQDIKASSTSSDSSSSSDDEGETTIQKKDNERLNLSRPPINVSQTVSHKQENQWPVVALGYAKPIKRRLNIKAPSASSDSSSRSESEDDTTGHTGGRRPGMLDIGLPLQESKTKSEALDGRWSALDLHHIPHIRRHLDFKATRPASDSSSSSDSENETFQKRDNERLHISIAPVKVPQTVTQESKKQWPSSNLGPSTSIKRDQEIKASAPSSDSSSSSDSEGETAIQKKDTERLNLSRPPVNVSQTVSHKPENQWPVIDLGYAKPIKRRLNIKAPLASSDSSSRSESYDDTTGHTGSQRPGMLDIGLPLQEAETKNQASDVRGLAVDLQHIGRIKRRLDIKAPTPSSHSSSSEDETTIQKMGNRKLHLPLFNVGITGHSQEGKMGEVNKTPSYSSSSSDDEDPVMKHFNNQTAILETDPNSKWPKVGFSGNLHIKKRLDIKAHFHSRQSSSSTEGDVKAEDLRVPKTDRNHVRIIPNVNRRLDIKAPLLQHNQAPSSMLDSQHSELHSSSSESEDEKGDSEAKVELGVTTMFAKRISQNQNQNVKLERYTILTDGNKPNADTPEINQDLQKKWADMKLGISRSRKRLEITSKAKEAPSLSSTQPDSPYSSSSDSGSGSRTRAKRRLAAMHEITHTDPTSILKNRPVNVSATSEKLDKYRSLVEIREGVTDDYSFHGSGEKSKPDPILADFSPPHIRDTVTAPGTPSQKPYSSSSSSSENETVDQSVADLRAGVPRLKRRLNVKAPLPQLSSSQSSSSENDEVARNSEQSIHSSTHLGRRDDYPIPYKRSIIRAPLVPTNPLTPRGRDQPVDFTKESPMEVDLPIQVRWAGIGRHPSDISLPKPTNVNAGSTSLPQATPAEPKSSSLDPSDSLTITNIIQDSGSPSNKTNDMSESVPEDKKAKRGLGALKTMASERRIWESPLDKDASPSLDGQGPQDGGSFEKYAKAKSAQPFKQLKLPSASADEKQTGYLLHGMPLYRRHNIRDIKPPQEAPPPIPDTPLPDY